MHAELSVPTKGFAVTFAVRKYLLAVVQDLRGASVNGFLRTGPSFKADVNLVVQGAMGVALIAGAFLARAKCYTGTVSARPRCCSYIWLLFCTSCGRRFTVKYYPFCQII